jgi:hypothetical protein
VSFVCCLFVFFDQPKPLFSPARYYGDVLFYESPSACNATLLATAAAWRSGCNLRAHADPCIAPHQQGQQLVCMHQGESAGLHESQSLAMCTNNGPKSLMFCNTHWARVSCDATGDLFACIGREKYCYVCALLLYIEKKGRFLFNFPKNIPRHTLLSDSHLLTTGDDIPCLAHLWRLQPNTCRSAPRRGSDLD